MNYWKEKEVLRFLANCGNHSKAELRNMPKTTLKSSKKSDNRLFCSEIVIFYEIYTVLNSKITKLLQFWH